MFFIIILWILIISDKMDTKNLEMCKYNNCNFNSSTEYNLKIFFNNVFDLYRYEVIMIIIIIFLFNFDIGLIIFTIYIILYILNSHENQYFTNKTNKIKQDIQNDPANEIKYNNCRPATMNNPYANFLIGDNPNISACNDDRNIQNKNTFNLFNVYENSSDINIGSSNKAIRDFYTKTVTKYPPNTNEFAKWLYTDNKKLTCKLDNNCLKYDDIRYHTR